MHDFRAASASFMFSRNSVFMSGRSAHEISLKLLIPMIHTFIKVNIKTYVVGDPFVGIPIHKCQLLILCTPRLVTALCILYFLRHTVGYFDPILARSRDQNKTKYLQNQLIFNVKHLCFEIFRHKASKRCSFNQLCGA